MCIPCGSLRLDPSDPSVVPDAHNVFNVVSIYTIYSSLRMDEMDGYIMRHIRCIRIDLMS